MTVHARLSLGKTAFIALASSCSLVVRCEEDNIFNHSVGFNISDSLVRGRHSPIALEKDAPNPLTPPDFPDIPLNCASDETGFFGLSSDTNITIPYYYEIEYLGTSDLKGDILPTVEREISDEILPVLFACGTITVRRDLSLRHGRKLDAEGVSALPSDEVLESVSCEVGLLSNQHSCNVVGGALTIYTSADELSLRDDVLATIRNWMGRGDFKDVHGAIERITWIEINPSEVNDPNMQTLAADESNDGKNRSLYAAFALLGLIPMAALILYRKYRKRPDGQDSSRDSDEEEYNDEPTT